MKKILISVVTLTLAIAVLAPVAAYASTSEETAVCDLVQKLEKVLDAKCLTYENNCILAIKTEKFLSKKEYDQFKEDLRQQLFSNFEFENIIITRNPKAMHTIEEISKLSASEREKAAKDFLEKLLSQRPNKLPIQPR